MSLNYSKNVGSTEYNHLSIIPRKECVCLLETKVSKDFSAGSSSHVSFILSSINCNDEAVKELRGRHFLGANRDGENWSGRREWLPKEANSVSGIDGDS